MEYLQLWVAWQQRLQAACPLYRRLRWALSPVSLSRL
jgi:hypothetical protein